MPRRPPDAERWMREALDLARRGEGRTRPNPPVGAVVVRGGRRVGAGWHRRAGLAHAEALALREAGAAARGADLYVTLEPCSTHGRQPPCTDAILAAGVRRVFAAVADPNPRHDGRGLRRLRRAGIATDLGLCAAEAAELIAPFAKWIRTGRPYVTLKLAVSLDGRTADASGASRWIAGPAARRAVHDLRRRADAILVGAGTVRADDPSLLPRPARGRAPWRAVLAARGGVPPRAKVLSDGRAAQTVLLTTARCRPSAAGAFLRRGAQVCRCEEDGAGGVSPAGALDALGRLGALHVLCEGGGRVAAALAAAGLVDEYWFFVAPRLLGAGGRPAVDGAAPPLPGWELRIESVERLGDDVWIRARPARGG